MTASPQPARLAGRMTRLVQGTGDLQREPWATIGSRFEVALGPEDGPQGWPEAVAVYLGDRRLGWVNGGGAVMRGHLRRAWSAGWFIVVPAEVERVQGAPALRISAPWPRAVEEWLAEHGA